MSANRRPRLRLGVLAIALVATGLAHCGCNHAPSPALPPLPSPETVPADKVDAPSSPTSAPQAGMPWFEDITAASGIDFRHFDAATSHNYILETMGSGLGWIDYDNDGWLDLFCVQDGPLSPSADQPTHKLYRNNGDRTFSDATVAVGLDHASFGMGCAVGDYDNDGFDDLVVTSWKSVVLYHNEARTNGQRHFVIADATASLENPHWATSCGWGDIDGDGDLDLYVCNYAEVDLDHYPVCEYGAERIVFSCAPWNFPAVSHRLYRNEGNGEFADVTESSGIASASPAHGLGVILADLDDDGRIDIYAANDLRPAYLFHNQGNGQFIEKALFSGCALGSSGEHLAGMGVDVGDIDGTGRPSLFVTNFHFSQNVLYQNMGELQFRYGTNRSGLGRMSISRLGFGAVFCDVNLDAKLDLAVANGHVERHSVKVFGAPYEQEAQLFVGEGDGRFRDDSLAAGPYFRQARVGRGVAHGDFDNDGLPDLAFSHNGGPIALLHNQTKTENAWLRLELIGDGQASNRNAIGARIEIETSLGRQVRFLNGGGSYLSASERRLLVGLGDARQAERVTVRWPSGQEQVFANLAGKHFYRLREGVAQPELVELTPR